MFLSCGSRARAYSGEDGYAVGKILRKILREEEITKTTKQT